MSQTKEDRAKPCSYCGQTGYLKARATTGGYTRLFCHLENRSCYNACRGRYFETCMCVREYNKAIAEEFESWTVTHWNEDCGLHVHGLPHVG